MYDPEIKPHLCPGHGGPLWTPSISRCRHGRGEGRAGQSLKVRSATTPSRHVELLPYLSDALRKLDLDFYPYLPRAERGDHGHP